MTEPARGPRVVMLVDNVIVGDSRVQKEAMAMADRGWEVTLVGRRLAEKHPSRGRFGNVPARFVYVATEAGSNPRLERTTVVRSPLAYSSVRKQRSADALADA